MIAPVSNSSIPAQQEACQVVFHLPKSMFTRCFAPKDLERLSAYFDWQSPPSDDPDILLDTLLQKATNAQVIVTGWDSPPITDNILHEVHDLKVILHSAGSIRTFIPDAIWDSHIRIATCNDALGQGVAETTLGLIIASLKGFFPCVKLTQSGNWQSAIPKRGWGRVRELYDVTIGLIGASRTGRHVLRLLDAFEADVVLYDPTISNADAELLGVRKVELDELLQSSDVVSLHAPALPELRRMLKGREFQLMKDDAIFINTARGMLIDESALIAELETGRISAVLDVTYPEPPTPDHPFRKLSNVVLLPHIAGALTTGCLRMGRSAVDQLIEFRQGDIMSGEISRQSFAVMA